MTFGTAREIDQLGSKFPLPIEGLDLEKFQDTVVVSGVPIHLAGFAVEVDGECITGSAAALGASPMLRAYMELVERLSILVAMGRGREPVTLRDAAGNRVGLAPSSHVFPESPDSSRWRWARSNGVAIAETWADAAERARWELIERDRILRSFYGEIEPKRLPISSKLVPPGLQARSEFEAYGFDAAFLDGTSVAMLVGFPEHDDPLVYGFGCRATMESAVEAASRECIQRLGFLSGEPLPDGPPSPTPTPDFHQEYYLFAGNRDRVRRWLRGEHTHYRGCLDPSLVRMPEEPLYADLTPRSLEGCLHVAKAIPHGHVPLAFGFGHPLLSPSAPDDVAVHPIA